MTIEWEAWQTVLAIIRAGTLTGAAGRLGIDATTAGRRLRRLERRLGRRLFEREGGVLVAAPACADLLGPLATAERALEAVEAATLGDPAAGLERSVRITSVAVIADHVLAPAVGRLLAERRLRVELIGDNRNLSLARREADVAVRLGPPFGKGAPAWEIGRLRYAAYAVRGAAADRLPWVGYDTTLAHLPEFRWVEAAAGAAGVGFRVNRLEGALALVQAGVARALLPLCVADRCDRLVRLGPAGVVSRPIWLIVAADDADAPHIRAVRRWITDLCGGL